MGHYRIKNITSKLAKRHVNKDTSVKIEYHVGFQKKFRQLRPNDEIIMTCRTLPVSIHNLRVKSLITVIEISENEFLRLQKPSAKKSVPVKEILKKTTPNIKKEKVEEPVAEKESVIEEPITDEVEEEKTTKKKTSRKRKTTSSTVVVKDNIE